MAKAAPFEAPYFLELTTNRYAYIFKGNSVINFCVESVSCLTYSLMKMPILM